MSTMTIHLSVWRQKSPQEEGGLVSYEVNDVSPDMSFLELLDKLNEDLIMKGEEPVAFDSDCREGICGTCGLVINGVSHGPRSACTTCELRMRSYRDGDHITVEPFRAQGFPIVKDLVVDRSSFERIISAGGYISINAGSAPDANSIPISKTEADEAMDSATCIGCGACVAACPNASAALFTGAKITQFVHLPQGREERRRRALKMVQQMDKEGFGACSNHGECEAVCPKEISISNIAAMRREYMKASLAGK